MPSLQRQLDLEFVRFVMVLESLHLAIFRRDQDALRARSCSFMLDLLTMEVQIAGTQLFREGCRTRR